MSIISSDDGIQNLITGRVIVPTGATLAVLFDLSQYENSMMLKHLPFGGTCEILGITNAPTIGYGVTAQYGATLAGATLAAMSGTGYLLGIGEVFSIDGPCRFYISNTGATATFTFMKGLTA